MAASASSAVPDRANEPYLADATLQLLGNTNLTHLNFLESDGGDGGTGKGRQLFKAKDLWWESGAVVLAEARTVSSLKPELDARGIKLYAVLRESLGYRDFLPFFDGEVFLDTEMKFYGPKFRKRGFFDIFHKGVFSMGWKYRKQGIPLNLKGDGWTLGGIFVLGPGDTGLIYEYPNKTFEDTVDTKNVIEAANKIKPIAEAEN
ncbi:peroxiredoxin-like 2A [Diadema antillarum]|uniref:peroxiredoxin-like 2A n=1 Tax=Diadema antillarum TaxID=105358 RepID=UPI003A89EE15